jgi:hypothetical protein
MIKVIALDLEGTLISTLGTQIARPGLFQFLENCKNLCNRIVIFTLVDEHEFRAVAKTLVQKNLAPDWFQHIDYFSVGEEDIIKDLRFINDIKSIEEALIVDDCELLIHPDQKQQWLEIKDFDFPHPVNDNELERIYKRIESEFFNA